MDEQRIRVLLIEDNPGDTRLIREMLAEAKNHCFEVKYCDHLSAGLESLAAGNIDVVLSDLGLPDSQGLDTLARVRSEAEKPVVVLTSLGDEAIAAQAVELGAQDYLVKGEATANLLARTLFYAIERFRMQKRMEQYAWELQRAELRLRKIVKAITDGIVIVDKNGMTRFVNPAAEYILNRKAHELLGRPFDLPLVPGETTELNILRNDSQTAIIELRVTEIECDGENVNLASLHDITERRRAEKPRSICTPPPLARP